jgi:putative transposase
MNEMPEHVHMVLSIPPKFSVAMVVGYLKGKSAIQLHRQAPNVKRGYAGKHFWSRGYCVSTVGLDEQTILAYVRNQEEMDRQEDLFNP